MHPIEFYKRHRRWMPILFFLGGFAFDAFMLRRVDELLTIVQQSVYLVLCAIFIRIELIELQAEIIPHRWIQRVWRYRREALNFLMGTLLNAYTIFFFKSSSALTSFLFIGFLVLILILNEFGRFGKLQLHIHVAFLSVCLISFMVTLVPIVIGIIGPISFLLANVLATLIFYIYILWVRPIFNLHPGNMRSLLQVPFATVLALFALLYFTGAIPPVPLSVRSIGVYHDVKKVDGSFELTSLKDEKSFWALSSTFLSTPGEPIFCFVRVFSPARFKDDLVVRWLRKNALGDWESSDRIPFHIEGGREEGYRGFTRKTHYDPGKWRVQIETQDGRELGRLNFEVKEDASTDERTIITHFE